MIRAADGSAPLTGSSRRHVVVIGGGFCGLAAAYELGRRGIRATLLERDDAIGGLAGSFTAGGARLEKFYHHWYTHDGHVRRLIEELGCSDRVLVRPSRTGVYYADRLFKFSTPADLLRFRPLPFHDRLRLGLLLVRARRRRDWRPLEQRTAADWLRSVGGERVYRVVWEPLLQGKFGDLAEEVSAAWLWNKLKLRGGSRRKAGPEQLLYYRGGFAALADAAAAAVRAHGGAVRTGAPATGLRVAGGRVTGVVTPHATIAADGVIATPALPIVADLIAPHAPGDYVRRLRRIRYLANVCVVLELDRSLSDYYWMNVNDPSFPFVGVIEHTNFEPASTYAGRHVVYLSRYLSADDEFYRMPERAAVAFTVEHLRRMFPDLTGDRILAAHVWRARYAQPVVVRGYSRLIPATRTPLANLLLATMAQIYPEDRGTNQAIRQGRDAARTWAALDAAAG